MSKPVKTNYEKPSKVVQKPTFHPETKQDEYPLFITNFLLVEKLYKKNVCIVITDKETGKFKYSTTCSLHAAINHARVEFKAMGLHDVVVSVVSDSDDIEDVVTFCNIAITANLNNENSLNKTFVKNAGSVKRPYNCRKVFAIRISNGHFQVFDSMKEASKYTGAACSNMQNVCDGIKLSAAGWVFGYSEQSVKQKYDNYQQKQRK